ncbi:MAG: Aldehyde dehydrogenase [Ferruginibacter sp.]|nr:Aldehyde dehydrogenase [Ferruginibacter sp.]
MFNDTTAEELSQVMEDAWEAFHVYRKLSLKQRADFMRSIAVEMENAGDELIQTAMQETNLPEARLRGERARTIFQLNSYAQFCESGQWLEARIDTAVADKVPAKPDLRKMLVPLGPVVVFGASNFPFAYSTAGGDTACAFAAGCPVIVKAHPAHAQTSELVAAAISRAAANCYLPKGIFAHVHGASSATGEALVKHHYTKAVGFTGSFAGGKQLFDWGNQRKEPIPVFAEMGSVNPVFLLPEKISVSAVDTAKQYALSITQGVGQFCTNPGVIIGIDNNDLDQFIETLAAEINNIAPAAMLHPGIYKSYVEKRAAVISQPDVAMIAVSATDAGLNEGTPTIASTTATAFLANPMLQQEVFGPYSIVVRCADMKEMMAVALQLEGQLTSTLMATENDMLQYEPLLEAVKNLCGRLIMNGIPTGVEVCLSMQHGGPFPATTDSRFTSVGADGIKRFARPVAFQNWSDSFLPDELKNSNPLGIWRTVNNELTKEKIG